MMQMQDYAKKDRIVRGVGVYATLLPSDKNTEPTQFGKWSFDSDENGLATFTNLNVGIKGEYRIKFWLDVFNSSSFTTSPFTGAWRAVLE